MPDGVHSQKRLHVNERNNLRADCVNIFKNRTDKYLGSADYTQICWLLNERASCPAGRHLCFLSGWQSREIWLAWGPVNEWDGQIAGDTRQCPIWYLLTLSVSSAIETRKRTDTDRTRRQHGRPWDRARSVFSVSADDKTRVNTAGTTDTGTTDGNREDIHAGNLITVPIAAERFDKIVTDRKYPYDKEETSGVLAESNSRLSW